MEEGNSHPESRGKSAQSDRSEEEYRVLDADSEGPSRRRIRGSRKYADDDEDSDTFMLEEEEGGHEIDSMDEEEGDEEEEEGDDEDEEAAENGGSIGDVDSEIGEWEGAIPTTAAVGLYKPRRVPKASGKIRTRPVAKKKARRIAVNKMPDRMHARGINDWGRGGRGGALENRVRDLFGRHPRDLDLAVLTKNWWLDQTTLPRRTGSLRRSFYASEAASEREVKNTREWYANSGSRIFAQGQKIVTLAENEWGVYLASSESSSLNFIMGTVEDPRIYTLERGDFLSTAPAFDSQEDRCGWVMNLGAKIQDAQWATTDEGRTQYLAVVVEQKSPDACQHPPLENPQSAAFSPTSSFPASIQIWSFQSTETGSLDVSEQPKLELVICTDWGAPKQLRWSPVAVTDFPESPEGRTIHLGLLAVMFSDGKVRILDVSWSKTDDPFTHAPHIRFARSAFELQIPYTMPTCIHWLSPTSLAVATAAGTLAVWTLTRPDTYQPPADDSGKQRNPQPWFHRQVADTLIVTLTSGYPSQPTYISITTADGYSKLIDLRSPVADTAQTGRGRIFSITQAWHEHTQSFLTPDEAYLLRSNTLRRYYTNIYTMRTEAQIVRCATSSWHPGVLISCADGTVIASNPLEKVLNYRKIPRQQIWFAHEWRPAAPAPTLQAYESDSLFVGQDEDENMPSHVVDELRYQRNFDGVRLEEQSVSEVLSRPTARMTEGYRVRRTQLQPLKPGEALHTKDFVKPVTVFEEPSCVTALAWNPNLECGTWAVAGMGDGLLRVEDVGV